MDGSDRQSAASSESPAFLVPRAGDVLDGKYRIESVLGRGGMGIVFAARNERTSKRVALKWMLPHPSRTRSSMERLLREAEIAGGIEHPNVITIYDVGFQHESAFLVMEHLSGEPLSALMQRCGALGVGRALGLLLPAMRGVEAAHAARVVHRDLKPANIFICSDACADPASFTGVKVLDFGISKVLDGSTMQALTESGGIAGTLRYMCAEQLRGEQALDQRVDVYAFGVMLYEALTGRLPFESDNCFELMRQIGSATSRRPRELRPDLPEELDAVIMKAMARERADRHREMRALIAALAPFAGTALTQAAVTAHDATRSEPRLASAHRRWLLAVAALSLLAAAVAWRLGASSQLHPVGAKPARATIAALPIARAAAASSMAQVTPAPSAATTTQAARSTALPPAALPAPSARDRAGAQRRTGPSSPRPPAEPRPGAGRAEALVLSPWARAQRLLQEAYGLSAQHRDAEALSKARQAYQLHPAAPALFQIASKEAALGLHVQAYTDLRTLLDASDDSWVFGHRAQLQRDLAALETRLVRLTLKVEPAGARVRINGEDRGVAPLPDPLVLAPGRIVLDVRAAGFSDHASTLHLESGSKLQHLVTLRLQSLARESP